MESLAILEKAILEKGETVFVYLSSKDPDAPLVTDVWEKDLDGVARRVISTQHQNLAGTLSRAALFLLRQGGIGPKELETFFVDVVPKPGTVVEELDSWIRENDGTVFLHRSRIEAKVIAELTQARQEKPGAIATHWSRMAVSASLEQSIALAFLDQETRTA